MSGTILQKRLLGKVYIKSTIEVKTGLLIGAGEGKLDIGGIDKLVIRDPITEHPYIPGSSLKGKLRSILEINHYQGREDENGEEYVKVKGRNAPARLIVRDSHLQEKSEQELKKINTGLFMTERKWENGLDRITSAATPRQFERVPKGAKFDLEMVYTIEQNEVANPTSVSNDLQIEYQQAIEDLENLAIALAILEDDALGGSGSRGYGKVKFEKFKLCYHDYAKIRGGGKDFDKELATPQDTSEFLNLFENNAQQFQQCLLGRSR